MTHTLTPQGKPFVFTKENLKSATEIVGRYPEGRAASALLPLLDMAQRQVGGWVPQEAIEYLADFLKISKMQVFEVASFYTMFNLKPVGKYLLQVCTTTPCQLCGSDGVLAACNKAAGVPQGETSEDGLFTVMEVECLGACVNAPILQINDDYYEDLNAESTAALLQALKTGQKITPGSQTGRQTSAPAGGLTTLLKKTKGGRNA